MVPNSVADEPLGYSNRDCTEWTLIRPVAASAALGHWVLGLPGELLYQGFYGMWVDSPEPVGFDHIPGGPLDEPGRRVPSTGR